MSAAVRSGFSIFALIFFLLNVWFLYAVDKLGKNGCKCAEGWRRSFIEFMLAVFVILFIVGLIFPIGTYMVGILLFVYFAFFVAYIIITRQFMCRNGRYLVARTDQHHPDHLAHHRGHPRSHGSALHDKRQVRQAFFPQTLNYALALPFLGAAVEGRLRAGGLVASEVTVSSDSGV